MDKNMAFFVSSITGMDFTERPVGFRESWGNRDTDCQFDWAKLHERESEISNKLRGQIGQMWAMARAAGPYNWQLRWAANCVPYLDGQLPHHGGSIRVVPGKDAPVGFSYRGVVSGFPDFPKGNDEAYCQWQQWE